MGKTFEEFLTAASGKVREINYSDAYERRKSVSTYYMNNANNLRSGALVIWFAIHDGKLTPEDVGLGRGWSFSASLYPVFNLLAGLSIELILKAIAKILDRPDHHHHRLVELCENVGLTLTDDHVAILDILTEEIYWESRYPVPRLAEDWEAASKVREKQWKDVPNSSSGLKFRTPDPNRSLNLENYNDIWAKLFGPYWRAKEKIYEG
jgi:hypothetical protein